MSLQDEESVRNRESGAVAQMIDPVEVSPDWYKTILENDYVRVLMARGTPGSKNVMHSHPAHAVYIITGSRVRFESPGDKPVEVSLDEGEAMTFEPTTHSVENIGSSIVNVLIVERKDLRSTISTGDDPLKVSPSIFRVLAENEVFRVIELRIKPGERDNPHGHPHLVYYSLSDSTVRLTSPDGGYELIKTKAGDVMFRNPIESHQIENIDSREFSGILFELKN